MSMPAGFRPRAGSLDRERLGLGRRPVVVADEAAASGRRTAGRDGAAASAARSTGRGAKNVSLRPASGAERAAACSPTASGPARRRRCRARASVPIGISAKSPATRRWTTPPISKSSSPSRTYSASSNEWTWRREPAARRERARPRAPCGRRPAPGRRGRCRASPDDVGGRGDRGGRRTTSRCRPT